MPLPTPDKHEQMRKFISRCMGDPIIKKEFPDIKQRAAVCRAQFDRKD